MSNDGPTLNDDSRRRRVAPGPGTPTATAVVSHSHPLTAGPARPSPRQERGGGGWRDSGGHDFDLPALPAAVDVFDTTLRDGSQQEGLSLTVDDKLRVAEQLDHLGVTFIEGGWPGANPKDAEFFARAPTELSLSTVHPGGIRVHPPRRGARPRTTRPSAIWSTPRPRRCASWPSPRRCTWSMPCAPPSTRRWPWWPTRWSSSGPTTSGSSSTPSTSSTGTRPTPSSRPASCGPPKRPAPRPWSSATPTAAPFPTR